MTAYLSANRVRRRWCGLCANLRARQHRAVELRREARGLDWGSRGAGSEKALDLGVVCDGRGVASSAFDLCVCVVLQEQLHHLHVPATHRIMQSSLAI